MQKSAMMNNRLVHKLEFGRNNHSVTLSRMLSKESKNNIF